MKRIVLPGLLTGVFILNQIYAQEVKIPEVIPPSPDAAALGKYGNTPVGLNTGIPQISIPLYTVSSGSLSLPISISYHASGITVNEIASWVGLGWNLNAGGAISRSVVGESDEGGFWINQIKTAAELTNDDYDYLLGKSQGNDGESDFYFYNFNGRSGKFVYGKEDGANKLLILPKQPLKIEFVSNHFEVTDELGTKYIFGQVEVIQNLVDDLWTPFNSSYFLTDIFSADGKDNIHLSYTTDGTYTDSSPTFSETIGQLCTGVGPPQAKYHSPLSTGSSSRMIDAIRLSQITFANGRISFTKLSGRLDAPQGRLGSMLIEVKNSDGTYSTIKNYVFDNDQYFVSGSGSSEYNYRLKLDGLEEYDGNNLFVRKHQFFYDESIALPKRNSLAQDWWGYYNGQTGNTSFIATEDIYFENFIYHVGAANREPSGSHMKAGILNKIVYPTGGYTELDFEPHQYIGSTRVDSMKSVTSAVPGSIPNTTDLLEKTITFTPTRSGPVKINTFCSDAQDGPPYSNVRLKESGGQTVLYHEYSPPFSSPEEQLDHWEYLTKDVTYELVVQSKGTSSSSLHNGGAFASATVFWKDEIIGQRIAGGLRVAETRDYSGTTAQPLTKVYKYGLNDSGNGALLIPEEGINTFRNEIITVLTTDAQPICGEICRANSLQISGNPMYSLTTLNGAPVVYEQVTVYEKNTSAPNGKTVLQFEVVEDIFMGVDKAYKNGRFQTNESWRGGDEVWDGVYTTNLLKVMETSNSYLHHYQESVTGTKVGVKTAVTGPCSKVYGIDDIGFYFYYFDYTTKSGISKLGYTCEKLYGIADPEVFIENEITYYYDNPDPLHLQLSRQVRKDSEGGEIETRYWYPKDYDGNVDNVSALLNQHIIGIPIKTEMIRDDQLISGTVNRLNPFGKPIEVYQYEANIPQPAPAHQNNVAVPAGYDKKLDISYDGNNNIAEVLPESSINTVYLWGYDKRHPVAKIDNISYDDISASVITNIENHSYSNSDLRTDIQVDIDYLKNQLSGIINNNNYVVSLYTYNPLKGITSQTDPNGVTTFYEYDDFTRLKLIKDENGNIIQHYQYHYKEQ